MSRATAAVLLLLAALAPWARPAEASGRVRRYALIVGNNRSLDDRDPVLRYADDDATRLWELLGAVSDRSALLTVPDARTQRLHPRATEAAVAPSRKNLDERFADLNRAMRAARLAGDRPVLYLFFSGHGGMAEDREAYLHLLDHRLTRRELFTDLIKRSEAAFNHVIIDACHSYFMVRTRGAGGPPGAGLAEAAELDLTGAVEQYLEADSLERHPNTGALVATSGTAETHEWGLFESGVFSHQVRSGLAGAADVDGDGAVTYDEMRAFLAAANAKVPPGPARLATFARAPRQRLAEPLLDLSDISTLSRLHLPPGAQSQGRFYLEDARGVRWADLNKARDADVTLVLASAEDHWLRTAEWEARVPAGRGPRVELADLRPTRPGSDRTARGATADLFSATLFAEPFGPAFAAGFAAGPHPDTELTVTPNPQGPPPAFVSPWVLATAGSAVALGIGAAVSGAMAVAAENDYLERFQAEGLYDRDLAQSAERRALAANVMLGAAFASAGAAAVLHLTGWLAPAPSPAGVAAGVTFP